MKIEILHLIEGAKKASGLTVIIDVFRAFSLECYLYGNGARQIIPVGEVDKAFQIKEKSPEYLLVGERNVEKCEGFDYGNSPFALKNVDVEDKTIIHTTSAGTQGIVNAKGAGEIITGSLVNAKAVAAYIQQKSPQAVSLVCMGNGGVAPAKEDELCAEYIKSILDKKEIPDIQKRAEELRFHGGEHFFDKKKQHIYPEGDFWMCTHCNKFSFVIKIIRKNDSLNEIVTSAVKI